MINSSAAWMMVVLFLALLATVAVFDAPRRRRLRAIEEARRLVVECSLRMHQCERAAANGVPDVSAFRRAVDDHAAATRELARLLRPAAGGRP